MAASGKGKRSPESGARMSEAISGATISTRPPACRSAHVGYLLL